MFKFRFVNLLYFLHLHIFIYSFYLLKAFSSEKRCPTLKNLFDIRPTGTYICRCFKVHALIMRSESNVQVVVFPGKKWDLFTLGG